MKKGCLILANGYIPSKADIKYLQNRGYNYFICADGGANSAFKLKLIPDIIIGDLDSISTETYKHFDKTKTVIKKLTRQNDTDVEKCLKHAIQKKFTDVILLGATGNRLDHTFCNIGIALKFRDKISVKILHEKSFLSISEGVSRINAFPGETISIYGIEAKTIFSTKGLKYPLKNAALPFGLRESTSNVATSSEVEIVIKNGPGIIVRDFEVIKKNDFLF